MIIHDTRSPLENTLRVAATPERFTGLVPCGYDGHGCMRCTPEVAYSKPDGACPKVHCRNRQVAYHLVQKHGFAIHAEHLGGQGHRQLLFDIWSGYAWMKHVPASMPLIPIKEITKR